MLSDCQLITVANFTLVRNNFTAHLFELFVVSIFKTEKFRPMLCNYAAQYVTTVTISFLITCSSKKLSVGHLFTSLRALFPQASIYLIRTFATFGLWVPIMSVVMLLPMIKL